jgi:hypothetical protein
MAATAACTKAARKSSCLAPARHRRCTARRDTGRRSEPSRCVLPIHRMFFATGPRQSPRRTHASAVPEAGLLAADPLPARPAARAAVRERPLCDRELSPRVRGRPAWRRRVLLLLLAALLLAPLLWGRP